MANPSVALTTLSAELGLYYEARLAELRQDYIADRVMPVREVKVAAGTFKKIPMEEILRVEPDLKRSPSSGYWRGTWQFVQDSYTTYDRGAEELIDDDESAMYSDFVDLAYEATERLVNIILMEKEMRIAATLMDTGVYTGALAQAVTNSYWSVSTSTPVTDVRLGADKFFANTGYMPDTLVISRQTFRALQTNPQVVNQITSEGAGNIARTQDVSASQMAVCFDVERVLVGGGAKNTAALGASPTIAHLWPKHAMLLKTARTSDMREPCIGRQFHWGQSGSNPNGAINVYRSEEVRSDVVRCRMYSGEKRIHTEMGLLIPNVLS